MQVMKPTKLTVMEGVVAKQEDLAEDQDWLFLKQEGNDVPAVQLRLCNLAHEEIVQANIGVRLPKKVQSERVNPESLATFHSS